MNVTETHKSTISPICQSDITSIKIHLAKPVFFLYVYVRISTLQVIYKNYQSIICKLHELISSVRVFRRMVQNFV